MTDRQPASRRLLVALGGGVAYALAGPPFDLYPLVFVGLALLAFAVARAPSARSAFGRAFVWAFAMEALTMRVIPSVVARFTPLGPVLAWLCLPLLAAAQSLAFGAAGGAASLLARRLRVPFPLAFAATFYGALLAPAVFAWTPAGLLAPWPALLQLADVLGERGVSAILAFASALVAAAILARRARPALVAALVLAALGLHGAWRIRSIASHEPELSHLKVGLVQPSIGALDRWNEAMWPGIMLVLHELSRRAEASGAELTVWPESSYPWVLAHAGGPTPRGDRGIVGEQVRGPVLTGLLTRAPGRDRYNSATIVGADGKMQPPQDKVDLLWFGETVPLGETFPSLRRVFERGGGLLPGERDRLLHAGPARIAVLNCYEDSLPSRGRALARLEPDLLVNVTNDAWFVPSAAPELHMRLSAMRAIELRRDLVRAVNLGVAAFIDATGRVRARSDSNEPSVLLVEPALHEAAPTLYARFGDAPVATVLAAIVAMATVAIRRRTPRA